MPAPADATDNPFEMAAAYRAAGWIGTIPIPLGVKWPPPKGFTGEDGAWPSPADVHAWLEEGPRNIAIRLPPNVIALDVDDVVAYAALIGRVGPLPPTWRAYSGSGRGGHYYYRLPSGVLSHRWQAPCAGVDLLRFEHRYSVVWPSVHPSGSRYGWQAPPGAEPGHEFPRPGDLPVLPADWVEHLSGQGARVTVPAVTEIGGTKVLDLGTGAPGIGTPITHNHDDALAAYAASLAAQGLDFEEIVTLVVRRGADCVPAWGSRPGDQSLEEAARTRWVPGALRKFSRPFDPAEDAEEGALDGLAVVDWHDVWANPPVDDWLVPGLLPARRGVALYSAPKVGKSLLALEMAVALSRGLDFLGEACGKTVVLYVDHENDLRGDVRSRLIGMGYGPEDLDDLRYLSMPVMGTLDSAAGAAQLLEVAQREGAELVVLDTVSRTVAGEENANDTWLAFYRHTGRALKAAGIAYLRLDHSGKDEERGMRGGSAKSGDVDLVWRLVKKEEDEFLLICDAHRLPVPAEIVGIHRASSPRLAHIPSTKSTNDELRRRGIYLEFIRTNYVEIPGYRRVAADLREEGYRVSDSTVKALLRDLRRAEDFEAEVALRIDRATGEMASDPDDGPVDKVVDK